MAENGITHITTQHSVEEILNKLQQTLQARGITLFAVIDHSGEAAKAGLSMPNTKLAIFGNPKGGTPLMLAAPSIALDLPIKLLIAENAEGSVTLSYNTAAYLQQRHGVPEVLVPNLAFLSALAASLAT